MATIQDIAKKAGVTKSTVSRYLNGGSISLETAQKIEKVINHICNSDITIHTFLESENSQNEEDKFMQNAVKFFGGEILEKK